MLGETVHSARIKKGLTQARLARLAGVSRRHLAALEKGANVSVLVVKKVASVLDLTDINLGPLVLHSGKDPNAQVNMRVLAETIREAHADTLRAQSLLAEAEGMMLEDGRKRGSAKPVVRSPKMPIRQRRDRDRQDRRRSLRRPVVAEERKQGADVGRPVGGDHGRGEGNTEGGRRDQRDHSAGKVAATPTAAAGLPASSSACAASTRSRRRCH